MDLNLADFAVITVLVGVGCILGFIGIWVMLRQGLRDQQGTTDGQLSELTGTLRAIEAKVAALSLPMVVSPIAVAEAPAAAVSQLVQQEKEEVTPETLVVIAAAVTAFLGKKVRIRSAKMLRSTSGVVNPWSQQGRVLVQGSHNLRLRG